MPNSKSSYQKLKDRNKVLVGDIYKLLRPKNKAEYLITQSKWNFKFDLEEVALLGSPTENKNDA
jgi:hypothetical protein